MPTTKRYYTQYAEHPSALDDLVNERLAEGWQLYGDPYIAIHSDKDKDPMFCQAMIRPETPRGPVGREQL
jgi:hypothetical protein